jgi:plasmid stabilization system protein ParE
VKIRFLEVAESELDETIAYYDKESPGLGSVFLTEVLSSLERIKAFPAAWHPLGKTARRCQTRRFPYGIIYTVGESEILILAIAHLHREPNYWRDRLNQD